MEDFELREEDYVCANCKYYGCDCRHLLRRPYRMDFVARLLLHNDVDKGVTPYGG